MAVYDALELRMIDQGRPEYVPAREGDRIEKELDRFIHKTHGYETGWVKVRDGQDGDRFVRYDRVASVSIVRGIDDGHVPIAAV